MNHFDWLDLFLLLAYDGFLICLDIEELWNCCVFVVTNSSDVVVGLKDVANANAPPPAGVELKGTSAGLSLSLSLCFLLVLFLSVLPLAECGMCTVILKKLCGGRCIVYTCSFNSISFSNTFGTFSCLFSERKRNACTWSCWRWGGREPKATFECCVYWSCW